MTIADDRIKKNFQSYDRHAALHLILERKYLIVSGLYLPDSIITQNYYLVWQDKPVQQLPS